MMLRFSALRAIGLALAGLVAISLAGCGVFFLPYGEATVLARATISLDGKNYSSQAVWRVKAQTQNGFPDSGINYRKKVLGDAITFDLGNGHYAFLQPRSEGVMYCAGREHREIEYVAAALPLFRGPCSVDPNGEITFVTMAQGGTPTFQNFAVDDQGRFYDNDGQKGLAPEIQALSDRHFKISSLSFEATSAPLGTGMTQRFPWILQLPRTDVCPRRGYSEDAHCTAAGVTYMQFFTTDLPIPE